MKIRIICLLILASFFLYIPFVLSGTLDTFESSSGSGSSSSSSGCGSSSYYGDEYYTRPQPTVIYPAVAASASKHDSIFKHYLSDYYDRSPVVIPAPNEEMHGSEIVPEQQESFAPSPCAGSEIGFPSMRCLGALRKAGFNGIPIFRLYGGYQKIIGHDIQGYNLNVQTGYGMIGLEVDFINYFESNPSDKLYVTSPRLLLRWPTKYIEFQGGLGATVMTGDRSKTGGTFGGAIIAYPTKWLMMDMKLYGTTFSDKKNMGDFDFGVSYKYKTFGVRAGYRALWTENSPSLHGPHAGLFFQW